MERKEEKTRICVSSAHRKETCVVTILNDMLMEYKILNRKEAQMRSTLLEKFIATEFPVELLYYYHEFRTFFVCICDPSSRR